MGAKIMKRRQFLKQLGGASAAVAALALDNPLKPAFRIAHADHATFANRKTLVCVYLRGGIDGINTVVPHGYPAGTGYYDPGFRPTIAVPKPNLVNPEAALDLGTGAPSDPANGLGLHPAMATMHQMYLNGNLAVMPAVHYANASRSHFSGQQYTESAKIDLETSGWLQRYLADSVAGAAPGAMRGAGISSGLPQSLRGQSEIVSTFSDLRNFELGIADGADEAEILAGLVSVYNQTADPQRLYASIMHDFGRVTINDLDIVQELNNAHSPGLDPDTYTTSSTTSDYSNSTFARQLKQTALLIKAEVGLEVACLSRGGFDTHSNQGILGGSHAGSIADVSNNVGAFFDDLNADGMMDNVLLMLMSEFGRTAYENGSRGTDHAHATSYFVAGSSNTINGGVYLGHENLGGAGGNPDFSAPITDWINYDPIADANMVNGRYMNHTIDYQNVFGEILSGFLDANYFGNAQDGGNTTLPTLLPEFNYSDQNKPGFLA